MSMMDKLPYYYRKSEVVRELYRVIQLMLNELNLQISAEDLKLFITTTEDFSLHEKDVGLSEINADTDTKRARVLTRLQGYSLLTKAELEHLIGMYNNNEGCTIIEDYEHYTIRISFSGNPHIIVQVMADVEELKPAHLKVEYDFTAFDEIEFNQYIGGTVAEISYERVGAAN